MRFACLIAACLMGTAPAFAAEEAVKLDFSVAVAGMKAIKLEYRANLTAQNYQADVGVDVKGIAEMFADLDLDLKASGAINGASLRPQAFEMKTTDEKQRRTTQVSWAPDGKPQGNRSFRLDEARAKAAEAALEPNMPDPLSALMAVALTPPETLCEGTLRTYNGTEVLDFAFRKLGTDTFLEENQGVYTGPATRCRLELKPVAVANQMV